MMNEKIPIPTAKREPALSTNNADIVSIILGDQETRKASPVAPSARAKDNQTFDEYFTSLKYRLHTGHWQTHMCIWTTEANISELMSSTM